MTRSTFCVFALALLLLWGASPAAGGSEGEDSLASRPENREISHAFLAECHFQEEDVALGATYRLAVIPDRYLGVFLHFSARPYYDSRIEEIRPGYRIVFDEFRWLIAVGLEEDLPLTRHIGLFAGGGAGYTRADYEATSRAPEQGWTPMGQAGLAVRARLDPDVEGLLRVGYRYIDLRGDDKDWWHTALGVAF